MKIALRIVALLRLYPSSVIPFPKSNLFGQHLHNSVCNCLSTYCLFKTLHLRGLFSLSAFYIWLYFPFNLKSQKYSIQLKQAFIKCCCIQGLGLDTYGT